MAQKTYPPAGGSEKSMGQTLGQTAENTSFRSLCVPTSHSFPFLQSLQFLLRESNGSLLLQNMWSGKTSLTVFTFHLLCQKSWCCPSAGHTTATSCSTATTLVLLCPPWASPLTFSCICIYMDFSGVLYDVHRCFFSVRGVQLFKSKRREKRNDSHCPEADGHTPASFCCLLLLLSFVFLGPHLGHMEVPRLGV